jgi:hypothetical protein
VGRAAAHRARGRRPGQNVVRERGRRSRRRGRHVRRRGSERRSRRPWSGRGIRRRWNHGTGVGGRSGSGRGIPSCGLFHRRCRARTGCFLWFRHWGRCLGQRGLFGLRAGRVGGGRRRRRHVSRLWARVLRGERGTGGRALREREKQQTEAVKY